MKTAAWHQKLTEIEWDFLYRIWKGECASRVELASRHGLARSYAGSVVERMLKYGILRESPGKSNRQGRPRIVLSLNPSLFSVMGITLLHGGQYANVKMQDAAGETLSDSYLTLPGSIRRWEDRCMRLAQMITEKMNGQIPANCLGACLVTTGTMSPKKGICLQSANFNDAIRMPILKYLQALNIPLEIANVTTAAVIQEHLCGRARGLDYFLQFSNTCEGMGAYSNGVYQPGEQSNFGEIGGMESGEGNGKKEFSSLTPIHKIDDRLFPRYKGDTSFGKQYSGAYYSFEEALIRACREGDTLTRQQLRRHSEIFAPILQNIVLIMDPEAIVLPSWCAAAPEESIEILQTYLAAHRTVASSHELRILTSAFNERDIARGACLLFLDRFFRRHRKI